ncbi:DUF192 domain-containing protein [Coriobacterium glomerans]
MHELGWCDRRLIVAHGFFERLVGLLGWAPSGVADGCAPPVMAFPCCSSVHTWFMRCRLDIAFLDRAGQILKVERAVAPCRLLTCSGAVHVLERPCDGSSTGSINEFSGVANT